MKPSSEKTIAALLEKTPMLDAEIDEMEARVNRAKSVALAVVQSGKVDPSGLRVFDDFADLFTEIRRMRVVLATAAVVEREECAKLADADGYSCHEKSFCESGEYGCHSRIAKKIRTRRNREIF